MYQKYEILNNIRYIIFKYYSRTHVYYFIIQSHMFLKHFKIEQIQKLSFKYIKAFMKTELYV